MKNKVYLLLGTNLNDRMANLEEAQRLVRQRIGPVPVASSVYETAAWGDTQQPSFLNQCIVADTNLQPLQVLKEILDIERGMGRVRYKKWGPRLIDIDILFYNGLICQSHELTIPHPHLHERRFTLMPLKEIAPALVHPLLNKSISKLLEECPDKSEAIRL